METRLKSLSEAQQLTVRTCFDHSLTHPQGRRYRLEWIYECLLMRIKSSRLYDHIRDRKILPLPCKETLRRYIQKISSSSFGFQDAVFECMKIKGEGMSRAERRGVLMVDEMQLTPRISFNKQTMAFEGFVHLGQHTPDDSKCVSGDHALVMMFVPFRGGWTQSIGLFISKNAVTSKILHKLILEAMILLENAGFHVDVVTSDGAQWNRGVWTLFGISETNISCPHPCNFELRLWFISDFPHLLKCFRNAVVKMSEFWTPEGTVKKSHWKALLDIETYKAANLKIAHKLTPAHLNPEGYEKMNVPLAVEYFSNSVAAAMEIYQDHEQLKDSQASRNFVMTINRLIRAMMAYSKTDALKIHPSCASRKAIDAFLKLLENWEIYRDTRKLHQQKIPESHSKDSIIPITTNGLVGMKVTLNAAKEILDALHKYENFEYLMTARLSQDPLERFFSIMRSSCGSNDHPDPKQFAQAFRLIGCYSLVKPPKGCNVSGQELLKTLMQTKESLAIAKMPRNQWLDTLDAMIEGRAHETDTTVLTATNKFPNSMAKDHPYNIAHTHDVVLAYVAG